jgi:hypothetical protein
MSCESNETNLGLGGLLGVDGGLLTHGGENNDVLTLLVVSPKRMLVQLTGVLALLVEELVDLVANLTIGNLNVVLGGTIVGHEGKETVVGNVKLDGLLVALCGIGMAWPGLDLQAGTPGGERWGRSCCGWKGRDLPTSCW